ncbi:uncharacterized protein LOC141696122 [Apium graveolens]|uniref:uncharacterized protein LOC141696122 n=1 Tax=Apium graveolens TaxID=4045 RepID=UPI003D7A53D0
MLKLHNWRARFGISDNAFTDLLSSVGSLLPQDHVFPVNAYKAKKTLCNLGLEYVKFYACPNECVLYRGVTENASECPKCRLSRWKLGKDGKARVNIPAKVMWYFPIIPRFNRMFKSTSTAKLLTWHSDKRIQDGQMRHPADSPSWQNADYRWPTFGNDPRNHRLALAADGINPHNNVLVSGPHEPGNNIDVFLQPLIDDLKKLWEEGELNVYDAGTKSFFTLRAMLLWTINDFPAYGNLSGCVNQGYMSCFICGDDTVAKYLSYSRKMCYQGHRRYLPRHHPYRRKKAAFNGEQEFGQPRQPLSGEQVLEQQEKIKFTFGNEVKTAKKHKSKDSEASRNDMMEMGIRLDLALQVGVKRTYLPLSIFTLTKAEKRKVLKSLLSMKLPYGHASNIKNCVSMADAKLFGLKSHGCHILLQQLFPVAILSVLPKNVRVSIIRLCFFFNSLCNKVVDVSKLEKLQADVVLTLCELEKIFPPSFFNVMIHLTVHLVRELRLCGPVFYRWMFPFER